MVVTYKYSLISKRKANILKGIVDLDWNKSSPKTLYEMEKNILLLNMLLPHLIAITLI